MSYSPNLTYFLDRLSGFSTNVFKMEAQGNNTANANSIIRFNLPSNALLNMRSFALHFTATTAGTAAGGRLPNKIESLIERVEVSVGGVQLSAGSNYYNVLCHAKQALMGSKCDAALGHPEIVRQVSYIDGSEIAAATAVTAGTAAITDNEVYTGSVSQFCIDKWEGFLGSCEPKILDSSLLPDIVVSIYLTNNNVLCSTSAVAKADFTTDGNLNATFSLSNIHATIESLGLADSTYDTMISQMISQRGYIEVPFKQYIAFQDVTQTNMRFSVATACLDRIWIAHRAAAYSTQAAPVKLTGYSTTGQNILEFAKEKYTSAYFNFTEPSGNPKYQFQLNGALYPQFQASFEEMHQISRNSVMSQTCHARDNLPLNTIKNNYAVQCIRLNMPESEFSRTLSGLDTRGISLNGFYNLYNASSTNTPTITLFAECTSVMRVGSGKQVEIVV